MSVLPVPATRPVALPTRGALRRIFERDALSIVVVCAVVFLLAVSVSSLVVSDTWLALVDGRLVAAHGVPHVDTLAAWTQHRPWTDQQWGSQLILYGLADHLGLAATLAFGVLCVGVAIAAAAVASRLLGASPRSAAMAAILPIICASWLAEIRTQSLALVLFVAVYALLAADAQRPTRRVYLVVPLLLLWANLHGSAVLAAGLVALYGLFKGGRRLLVLAPLLLVASPYGLDLVHYYRLMVLHPPLASFVREWQPASFELITAGFFVSAFVVTAFWGRTRRSLTTFERWALPLLLLAGLLAIRNAVWFELAVAVSFPRLLDAAWPPARQTEGVLRINRILAPAAIAGTVLFLPFQIARMPQQVEVEWPPATAAEIARLAGPNGLVVAEETHADWLLWQEPSLAGRVAYDVRFELFDRRELKQLFALRHNLRRDWPKCGAGALVVTARDGSRVTLSPAHGPARSPGAYSWRCVSF
jgi:hypothetical protein